MAALARIVHRVRQDLDPEEGLLASVLGREHGGRRRLAIVATDRRLLLVALRPEPPRELAYRGLEADLTVADGAAAVTLRTEGATHEVDRIGDVAAARILVELIAHRTDTATRATPPPRVRVVRWEGRRGRREVS